MAVLMHPWHRWPIVCCGWVAIMVIWAMLAPAAARDIIVAAAGTGEPVPGVIVVFYWDEQIPGPDGGYERIVHAKEMITGPEGTLKDRGILSLLLKSRILYLYKPGYRLKSVRATEVSNTEQVELVKVATIAKDRRAEAAAFEAVVDPIVRCRGSNAICYQNLGLAPAAIYREYEFTDIVWHPVLAFRHGRVVENKVSTASPHLKEDSPRAPRKPRKGRAKIEQLTKMSQSPEFRVRQRAAYSLGHSEAPEAVELLMNALEDEHWQVRNAAAKSLGDLTAVDAASPLARALGDVNATVRKTAGKALAGMGTTISPVVMGVLSDPNPLARERAVQVLSKTGGEPAVQALTRVLNDPAAEVRKSAAIALGELNDPRATKPLLARLAVETVPVVKGAVLKALERIGEPSTVAPMKEIFMDDPKGACRQAGRVLMATDPEGLQALADCLQHTNADLRAESARLLGMSGNGVGTLPLVATLRDEDMTVRRNVIQALGRIADARAIAPLLDLWFHPSADLRSRAANAVVRHGQPAVRPLLGYLNAKDPYLRWRAAWALGNLSEAAAPVVRQKRRSTGRERERIRNPEAIAALVGAVNDPLPEVRWCAIRSLGALEAAEASPALETRLTDDDAGIRAAASRALEAIRSQR